MRNTKPAIIISGLILGMILSFTACEKDPSDIGVGLQPGSDKIILATDSLTVFTRTVKDSSIASDERSLSLLGSYQDDFFGLTNASFISQVTLSTGNVSDDTEISVDSMSLILNYGGYFGDTTQNINFKLYQINETDFDIDSTYYSDYEIESPATNLTLLGEYSFTPRPGEDTIAFAIEDTDFLSFFNNNNIYTDEDGFKEAFKGLYLEAVPQVGSGGCISYFNLTSEDSRLLMYYNDSLTYDFLINSTAVRINMFDHDYSSAAPELLDAINNPSENNEFAFIQSAAGLKVELRVEDTAQLNQLINKGINRAQLQVTVAEEYFNSTEIPEQLALVYKNEDNLFEFLTDYKVSSDHFGGVYNEDDATFTFNIPLYLQDLLSGNLYVDNYLSMFALSNRTSASYCAIYGGSHPDHPLQIKIITSDF